MQWLQHRMFAIAYIEDRLAFICWCIRLSLSCDQQLIFEKEDATIFCFTRRLIPPYRKILLWKEIEHI